MVAMMCGVKVILSLKYLWSGYSQLTLPMKLLQCVVSN